MLGYKKLLYSKLTENFQDGCDTIVAGCTTYGATPTSNSPTDIVNAIKKIYTDRYNSGVNGGKSFTLNATMSQSWVNSKGEYAGTDYFDFTIKYVNGSLSSATGSKSGTTGFALSHNCNVTCSISIKSITW